MDYGFALDALTLEPSDFCSSEFLLSCSDGVEKTQTLNRIQL